MRLKETTTTFTVLARISPLLFFMVFACRPCTEGAGPVEQDTFGVDSFSTVILKCPVDVYLSQNYYPEVVTVKAQQNIMDLLDIAANDQKIVIDSRECFSTKERVEVYLNSKRFNEIELLGSGDIYTLTDLRGSTLNISVDGSGDFSGEVRYRMLAVDVNGSGDVKLSGGARRFEVSINGSGDVSGPNMTCESTSVHINGSGDASVNAENYLEVNINGSGDVKYTGWPKDTTFVVHGSGDVSPNR